MGARYATKVGWAQVQASRQIGLVSVISDRAFTYRKPFTFFLYILELVDDSHSLKFLQNVLCIFNFHRKALSFDIVEGLRTNLL